MSISGALTALQTALQAASVASTLAVRSTAIYATPPETLPVLPALIHLWTDSRFEQWPQSTIPNGTQLQVATIECMLLTKEPTMSRAHATVLATVEAYRTVIAANQSLSGTVRQVRLMHAKHDELEYNGTTFHGAVLTLEADIYHAVTWVE